MPNGQIWTFRCTKIEGFATSGCRLLGPKPAQRAGDASAAGGAEVAGTELKLEIIHGGKIMASADNEVSMRLMNFCLRFSRTLRE